MFGLPVLLVLIAAAPAHAAVTQTYIEYRIVPDNVNIPPTDAHRLWRAGTRYARIEEPVDPKTNIKALTLISEPDIYMIDENAKRGRHMKDPDADGRVRIPIFADKTTGAMMELGLEPEFFKAHHAKPEADVMLGDVKCAVFGFKIGRQVLRLFIDRASRVPNRVKIMTPQVSYSIVYDRYLRRQPLDASLYVPPPGVSLAEGDAPEKAKWGNGTPFDDLPDKRIGLGFHASRNGDPLGQSSFLCRARPVVLLFFNPENSRGPRAVEHISALYRRLRNTQACFVAAPYPGDGDKNLALRYDFPVYKLDEYAETKVSTSDWHWKVDYTAAVQARSGHSLSYAEIVDDKSYEKLDAEIKKAIEANLPTGVGPDFMKTEVGDMSAQWKRVDMELSEPRIDRIKTLLDGKQFAEIDRFFAEIRAKKLHAPNGSWWLNGAYRVLAGSDSDDTNLLKRMALMREWIELYPESITPRVVLGRLWVSYAWKARGGDYANKLTERQSTLFAQRLLEAHKVLDAAKKLKEKCPELYIVMLSLGMGEGWPREEIDATFAEGKKIEPAYQYLYVRMAYLLMPKWYGEPGEWEEFARKVTIENPDGHGDELYARIALLLADDNGNDFNLETIFKKTGLSWPLVKKGEQAIRSRFPQSKRNANYYAFLACAAGDKETAREVMSQIGEDYSISVWGNRIVYEHSRRWANTP